MGFGIPVRNGLGVGIASYASLANKRLWTPSNISTSIWLDAADFSTISLNGSNVSQWRDKSGNNNHATQSTPANQPTYNATGFSGRPSIMFDGNGDGFNLTSSVFAPRSIIAVNDGYGFLFSSVDQRIAFNNVPQFFWNTNPSISSVAATWRTTTSQQIEQFDLGSSAYEVWDNGTSVLSGAASTAVNSFNRIGLKWDAATSLISWLGDVSEIVATSAVLSQSNRQRLEGYLAWKWGLVSTLPANHPYKNSPPTT